VTHVHETEAQPSDSIEHIALPEPVHLWSPEQPSLYDLTIRLIRDDQVIDDVQSYFGMRKVDIHKGRIRLNYQPYYMRLVLDQGYHPEGILTFPADGDFKNDIDLIKRMGFNGVRKHQKVEDPRFLYWADKLGLFVWGEMANAYQFSPDYIQRITSEWTQVIQRDYNHPCIVAWVPINESWGVPDLQADAQQRAHLEAMYYLTRSLDTTRLVVSNDGWEHAKTDILTIHDYESSGGVLRERYHNLESTLAATPANRDLFVKGYQHDDEPILLTELGGVAFRKSNQEGWGYSTAHDADEFLRRYAEIMNAVLASPVLQGYCYTQLTDVEQEINGLLTYDRQPKVDVQKIASINTGSGVHIT
jgi:beta-galactosidase/beta-glucuronidase